MTVTVTPTVELTNWPPRVRLNVSASAGETSTTVNRVNADGTTTPVRTYDGNPLGISGGTALLYDYEPFHGTQVAYTSLESPSTVSAQVTVSTGTVWIIHPGVPALSMPVFHFRPGTFTKRTATVKQGVFYPMGRVNPVIVSDGVRKGIQSSATVLVTNANDLNAIQAVTSDAAALLLNIDATLGYSMGTSYIAVGDLEFAPVVDKLREQWFDVTLPFYVVDRPAGGSQSQRSYADVLAAYSTYQQVQASYSTYTALLAGP